MRLKGGMTSENTSSVALPVIWPLFGPASLRPEQRGSNGGQATSTGPEVGWEPTLVLLHSCRRGRGRGCAGTTLFTKQALVPAEN